MSNVIITHVTPTKEGVTLHLNKSAKLKTSTMGTTEWYVSWDKIGKALIEGYTEESDVAVLRKLREEFHHD